MSAKLFVGNLAYTVTGEQLRELFAQAGTVTDAVVISHRDSGRSKGFGFVEMSTEAEAQEAVKMFHEVEFMERKMIVNEARPQEARPPGGGRDFGGGGDRGGYRSGGNDRGGSGGYRSGGNDRGGSGGYRSNGR